MRVIVVLLAGAALIGATPASAADKLQFGKVPSWVAPQQIPDQAAASADAPVALLLTDQQTQIEAGKVVTYSELALKIQKPEGLSAGNISIPWNPATDTVTVNKLEIHRGGKVIDVLAGDQKFVTMRRESGLDEAMLDGVLTANIQPEGLQEGDIIDLATTTEHADSVTGKHVEVNFADWSGVPIKAAHVHLDWPASIHLNIQSKGIVTPQPVARGDRRIVEISAKDVQPILAPKGAPSRFSVTRIGEATDFASWSDLAALMEPLYRNASTIPASGPLHDEIEKIRSSTSDPVGRAEKALQLVQDRVRYVALLMGQGGYVPADAETTWSRRFGDCKGKTALLLGILHSLGVHAEPLLVQSTVGDAIAERLPMLSYFDHVLVRAHVAGKTYFLDGTRTGDANLDDIQVPDFGWGLPIVADAKLIHLISAPLTTPQIETHLNIDASQGIYADAPASAEQIVTGDMAVLIQSRLSALSEAQRQEYYQEYWKKLFDFITYNSASTSFDKAKRQLHLAMNGKAKLDWSRGLFYVPASDVGYEADFDRPTGLYQDAPFAVAYPYYTRSQVRIHLPATFTTGRESGTATVHETIAGIEYARTSLVENSVLTVDTTQRSVVPEITAKEARQAAKRLRALADENVALPVTSKYQPTAADVAALAATEPDSAKEYFRRGLSFLQARAYDKAIADFTKAHELDSGDVWPLANRAIAHLMKNEAALAEPDLRMVELKQPDNAVLLRARGLMSEQKGDCAKAAEYFSKSLIADPGNSFALGHRAICEASLSKTEEALADSASALKSDPSFMDLRVLRANIFVRQGDTERVAKEAEMMTSENPTALFAYVAAGKIYARLGRTGEAMKAFDKALAIKQDAFVYINRAQARPLADRRGRLADLDAALKLDPRNSDALVEKAEQLVADGDLAAAKQVYDEVAKQSPEESYFKSRRAILLFKLGDVGAANKIFDQLHGEAKSANDFNSLCWAKATAGVLLGSALSDCREALKREPDQGAYLDSQALVELRMGNIDAAIADYSRAIAKNTSASFMGRAIAYARKGDKIHAAADLAEALKYDPDARTRFEEYGLPFDEPAAKPATSQLSGN